MAYEHQCIIVGGLVCAVGVAGIVLLPAIFPMLWIAALPVAVAGLAIAGDGGGRMAFQFRREILAPQAMSRQDTSRNREPSMLAIIRYWLLNNVPTDRRTSCQRIPGLTQQRWSEVREALIDVGAFEEIDRHGAWRIPAKWSLEALADTLQANGYDIE